VIQELNSDENKEGSALLRAEFKDFARQMHDLSIQQGELFRTSKQHKDQKRIDEILASLRGE
jgi:hypothetical protein